MVEDLEPEGLVFARANGVGVEALRTN